jgi:hypothetical protein
MKVFGDEKFQKDEISHPQKRGDVLKPVRQNMNVKDPLPLHKIFTKSLDFHNAIIYTIYVYSLNGIKQPQTRQMRQGRQNACPLEAGFGVMINRKVQALPSARRERDWRH